MSGATPTGFRVTELGDVGALLSGGTPSKERKDYWNGSMPWVTARDLKTTYLSDTSLHLSAAGASSARVAPAGAIFLLVRGMTLFKDFPVCIGLREMAFNQDIKALVVADSYDPRYVAYQLIALKPTILALVDSAGHGTGRLDTDALKAVPLKFPTLSEQQKISEFFGTIDAKLDALRRKKCRLEDFKYGLIQRLFSQDLRFTQGHGLVFPRWEDRCLGSIFNERNERGRQNAELLSVSMDRGVVRAADIGREEGASADTKNYKFVAVGDIAYNSMRMWQGASGLSAYEGIVSPAYTVITPHPGQCALYWSYRFKAHDLIAKFRQFSQGLTSDTWNLKFPALSAIRVEVPSFEEQCKIADALVTMENKITAVVAPTVARCADVNSRP